MDQVVHSLKLKQLHFQLPEFQYDLDQCFSLRLRAALFHLVSYARLNLYVYVDNNPLKYIDPTGHGVDTIIFDNFLDRINRDKTSELNIWIGDAHKGSSVHN
jgi:hypothetical protein